MTTYNGLLILLVLIPITVYELLKAKEIKRNKWLWIGFSVGLIIAPVSYALVEFAYVPIVGGLVGSLGAVVNLIHAPVGYIVAVGSKLIESNNEALSPQNMVIVHVVNAIIWASVYSILGHKLDKYLLSKKN